MTITRVLDFARLHLHDRTPGPHLCHDAARSPHVHCWPIVALAEKELGRAIPEGHHSVCVPDHDDSDDLDDEV